MRHVSTVLGLSLSLACCGDTSSTPDQKMLDRGVGDHPVITPDRPKGDGPKGDGPAACQPTTKKVEEFAPKPNAVPGWEEDLVSPGTAGLETGYTDGEIEGIIDGDQAPYEGKTDGFVREYYRKGNATLILRLWDLKSPQDAKALFESQKKEDETQAGITFTDIPNVAERAVLGDNKPVWKVWGHKCDYHWKIHACGTLPSSSMCDPATFDAVKPDVIAFIQYLAKQLP